MPLRIVIGLRLVATNHDADPSNNPNREKTKTRFTSCPTPRTLHTTPVPASSAPRNSFLHCVSRAQLSLLISPLSLIQRRVRSQCRSVRVCVSVRRTSRRFSSLVALARVRGWARQVLPLAWAWLARDGEAPSTIQLVNWGEAGARGGMML